MASTTLTQKQGFTIVELLIVIVVIGILAAITVVAFNGVQQRSRVERANSDITTLNKAIHLARISTGRTLYSITGSNCTRCSTDPDRYELTLDRISAASGANLDSLKAGDPWGDDYSIDENEGEGSTPEAQCATRDILHVINGSNKSGVRSVYVPFYNC